MSRAERGRWGVDFWRPVLGLLLLGLSFGYVEAAVVVYLRGLYEPLHQRLHPGRPDALFPLIGLEELAAAGPSYTRWLNTEVLREGATLVLLAGVALALGRNVGHGIGVFLVAFGLWDLSYYLFLKLLLGWPDSLLEWDLLFLLPVPWAAPVLAPLLVALSMTGTGLAVLAREASGRPLRLGRWQWAALTGGALVLVTAFCLDFPNLLAGGQPHPFPWPLFLLGEGIALAGFAHAWAGRPAAIPSLSPEGTPWDSRTPAQA